MLQVSVPTDLQLVGVVKSCIKKSLWRPIDHSATANGMHGFKMAQSSDDQAQIIHAPLSSTRGRGIVEMPVFSI